MNSDPQPDRSRLIDGWLTVALTLIIISLGIMGAASALPSGSVARTLVPWGLGLAVLIYAVLLASGYRSSGIFYVISFGQVLIASVTGVLLVFALSRLLLA